MFVYLSYRCVIAVLSKMASNLPVEVLLTKDSKRKKAKRNIQLLSMNSVHSRSVFTRDRLCETICVKPTINLFTVRSLLPFNTLHTSMKFHRMYK